MKDGIIWREFEIMKQFVSQILQRPVIFGYQRLYGFPCPEWGHRTDEPNDNEPIERKKDNDIDDDSSKGKPW